jgi:hypothetical protein
MDKLLALFAGADDQGDVLVTLRSATWFGASLHLVLAVSILESDPDSSTIWEVSCEEALAYAHCDDRAHSLELIDDHPVLWDFMKAPRRSSTEHPRMLIPPWVPRTKLIRTQLAVGLGLDSISTTHLASPSCCRSETDYWPKAQSRS